jgi:hypothetical protein
MLCIDKVPFCFGVYCPSLDFLRRISRVPPNLRLRYLSRHVDAGSSSIRVEHQFTDCTNRGSKFGLNSCPFLITDCDLQPALPLQLSLWYPPPSLGSNSGRIRIARTYRGYRGSARRGGFSVNAFRKLTYMHHHRHTGPSISPIITIRKICFTISLASAETSKAWISAQTCALPTHRCPLYAK